MWNFIDDVDAHIKPPDLILCLAENVPVMQWFDAFGASSKRFMRGYIKIAKTPKA